MFQNDDHALCFSTYLVTLPGHAQEKMRDLQRSNTQYAF